MTFCHQTLSHPDILPLRCDQPATVECGGRDEPDNGHYPEDCPDYDPDTPAPCVFPVGYFPGNGLLLGLLLEIIRESEDSFKIS